MPNNIINDYVFCLFLHLIPDMREALPGTKFNEISQFSKRLKGHKWLVLLSLFFVFIVNVVFLLDMS